MRTTRIIGFVGITALWLIALPANSQTPAPTDWKDVGVYGVGTSSCGTWLEARAALRAGNTQDVRSLQFGSYLDGYLSAYNTYVAPTGDALRGLDRAGRLGFLDKYCEDDPTTVFLNAITALIRQMENG